MHVTHVTQFCSLLNMKKWFSLTILFLLLFRILLGNIVKKMLSKVGISDKNI